MTLPANARIQAAQSFVGTVQAARDFLQLLASRSADDRYAALLGQLTEARQLLRWNPAAGHPARFLGAQSAQGRFLAQRAQALAAAQGLPQLRELVVKPDVLLYEHGSDRVVLLALKHERQLEFRLPPGRWRTPTPTGMQSASAAVRLGHRWAHTGISDRLSFDSPAPYTSGASESLKCPLPSMFPVRKPLTSPS